MPAQTHSIISPAILYWGTPVVLVSSENEDGTTNIAPNSSAWWLGHSCTIGLARMSQTTENILRTKQCVLNLADDSMAAQVNALALTTGSDPIPEWKQGRGYKTVKDKWSKADLTEQPADFVRPSRIQQCPVQMECELIQANELWKDLPDRVGVAMAIELRVLRVHVFNNIRMEGYPNRVDPDKWRPLIMSFSELYGLRSGKAVDSNLAKITEEDYRVLTKSDVKKLPGDDDADLVVEESGN